MYIYLPFSCGTPKFPGLALKVFTNIIVNVVAKTRSSKQQDTINEIREISPNSKSVVSKLV